MGKKSKRVSIRNRPPKINRNEPIETIEQLKELFLELRRNMSFADIDILRIIEEKSDKIAKILREIRPKAIEIIAQYVTARLGGELQSNMSTKSITRRSTGRIPKKMSLEDHDKFDE